MIPNVARYLNKTVLVSIPALFDDGVCRAYRLVGVELNGLWLYSEDLIQRLLPEDRKNLASLRPAVFVPFAQIAGVLITTVAARPPAGSGADLPSTDRKSEPQPKSKSSKENRK